MDWYNKSKITESDLEYLNIGHDGKGKALVWCLVKDNFLTDEIDINGDSKLHEHNGSQMWAYGRIDFIKGLISLVFRMGNCPYENINEAKNYAINLLRYKYSNFDIVHFED